MLGTCAPRGEHAMGEDRGWRKYRVRCLYTLVVAVFVRPAERQVFIRGAWLVVLGKADSADKALFSKPAEPPFPRKLQPERSLHAPLCRSE